MLTVTATDLPRIMHCEGSIFMPPSSSTQGDMTARDEGNAAHSIAKKIFDGADPTSFINTPAYNGFMITKTMVNHVSDYVSALDCGEMECDTSHSAELFQVNARCDHYNYKLETFTLTIDEFKYGFRLYEPIMNWTMIAHAIGLIYRYQLVVEHVIFRVHQPRPHHPLGTLRTWSITGHELLVLYGQMAAKLNAPSRILNTHVDHCAKCHAITTCPAARKASMNAIDATSDVFSDEIDNVYLSFELDNLAAAQATIKNRLDALSELAKHRLQGGQVIDNYGVEQGLGQGAWKAEYNVEFLSMITGVDLSVKTACTPAEAKRRNVPEKIVDALTYRPKTGMKLIRMDADTRARNLKRK